MKYLAAMTFTGFVFASSLVHAGPAEEANAVVEHWAGAYNANDLGELLDVYHPDASLLGTFSPIVSEGRDSIRKIFSALPGSGNKNTLGERRTVVLSDTAVLVTGFYDFTRIADGKPVVAPSRFTMVVTQRSGTWRLAHHHSSARPSQRN